VNKTASPHASFEVPLLSCARKSNPLASLWKSVFHKYPIFKSLISNALHEQLISAPAEMAA
jgi:hypothetical protein